METCVSMENKNADTKLCTLSTHVSGCFTRISRYQAVANINHEMEKLWGGEMEINLYTLASLNFNPLVILVRGGRKFKGSNRSGVNHLGWTEIRVVKHFQTSSKQENVFGKNGPKLIRADSVSG